jgi:hypothetical protein
VTHPACSERIIWEALQEFFEDVVEFLWVVDKEGVTVAVESL